MQIIEHGNYAHHVKSYMCTRTHFTEESALSNTIFIFLFWDEQSDI